MPQYRTRLAAGEATEWQDFVFVLDQSLKVKKMKQYLDLCQKVITKGVRKQNRTGVDHVGYTGDVMKFDLSKGFPAVTTKKLAFRTVVAEMLGFLRGYDSAADFRDLGCGVWDANANNNPQWLNNPNRGGVDDLGRIYGVQARQWSGIDPNSLQATCVDQLKQVYNDLRAGKDNRREIITHWNPFVIGKDGDGDLVCFCAPKRCRGDTLLRLANEL